MERKRRIIPPVWLLCALLAMIALHRFWPIAVILPSPWSWLGSAPLVAGIVVTASAARAFRTAGTPVVPFERSTVLVTGGLYRYTRNPMYLGLVLILLGVWLLLGTLSPLLPLVLFVWVIRRNFILGEERFLEGIFGEHYLQYKRRVRRWL